MAITLNHTIVPARDKHASARFFARIFGLTSEQGTGHFASVRVDFDDDVDRIDVHHDAFKVDEAQFDTSFGRVRAEGIAYGSGPGSLQDDTVNHRAGGRRIYFRDPDGHILGLLTAE